MSATEVGRGMVWGSIGEKLGTIVAVNVHWLKKNNTVYEQPCKPQS